MSHSPRSWEIPPKVVAFTCKSDPITPSGNHPISRPAFPELLDNRGLPWLGGPRLFPEVGPLNLQINSAVGGKNLSHAME